MVSVRYRNRNLNWLILSAGTVTETETTYQILAPIPILSADTVTDTEFRSHTNCIGAHNMPCAHLADTYLQVTHPLKLPYKYALDLKKIGPKYTPHGKFTGSFPFPVIR